MSVSKQIGWWRCLILALLLHSSGVFGIEWGEIELIVDEQQFNFDITVQDFPASMSASRLSIYTRWIGFMTSPSNEEQFLVEFTSQDGAVLGDPRVQPVGSPVQDRWQDGVINNFTMTEISPGTWRFTGTIIHGEDPFVPCDRIGSFVLEYPGGRMGNIALPIKAAPFPSMSVAINPSSELVTSAGQVVEYQYVVWNDGDLVLHNVAVTDDNVDAQPVCDFFGDDELSPRGELHSKVICTAQHTVTPEEMEAEGLLINQVTATSDEFGPVNSTVTIPIGLFINGFESPQNTLTVLDNTSCDVGRDSSIGIGDDGYPIISYHDLIESSVKFIKCTDAACSGHDETFSIVDNFTNGETSLALGNDDLPVIAYQKYDGLGTYLNVAKCNDFSCAGGDESISIVDGPGSDLGSHNSMAIGADGHPVISYFDQVVLRVVKCNDPSCTGGDETISIVDESPGAPGAYSSLAIGVDGYPVISYHHVDPGMLKVAKCNDPACAGGDEAITILDDTTEYAGHNTSIAIGMDGFPVISYSNIYDWELRVVKCNDAACTGGDETRSVVDDSARGSTAIAIGDDGLPVIAYTGGNQYALKVAKCNDAACSGSDEIISLVDPVSSGYISLAIGADGLPVISYFDNDSLRLKVVHCSTSSCSRLKVTP
jgi:hypothetical protein